MNFEPMRNFNADTLMTISKKKITEDQVLGWTIDRAYAILSLTDREGLHLAVRLVDLHRDLSRLIVFKETDREEGGLITPGELRAHVNKWSPKPIVNSTLTLS